ncbi:hypothetical protein ElP_50980 [Tautonia plasticadhaerens]|uniref:Uncharacterized protein n=1 Tax=Tautonia plasticadhaerens TaxID=2527974 RepID=A0A518H8J9_9BACT|nr:hypothetical protein ElP_50980 [Tautonia plasticadhaerens]
MNTFESPRWSIGPLSVIMEVPPARLKAPILPRNNLRWPKRNQRVFSRFLQIALMTTLSSGEVSTASDHPLASVAGGSMSHSPLMPGPQITYHSIRQEKVRNYHQRLEQLEDGRSLPGVYRTKVPKFRGVGFVARKHPISPDQYTMERAGNPQYVSHAARPSVGSNYTGYYVGGGASLVNRPKFPRLAKEGTWGWDYEHFCVKRRVNLLFSRGILYQDGEGQYEPDPPFEIANFFSFKYGERFHRILRNEKELSP